jgi:hypothetical protein
MFDVALHETVPCPCCNPSMKTHQWAMFCGALGDYLLSTSVSGIAGPQSEAMRGVLVICGLMRAKVVDKQQQAIKQQTVIRVLVLCEARLPIYTCRYVRHGLLHFYEIGGWADDLGPGPPLQK